MIPDPRSDCPINRSLEMLGDQWSLLILRDIAVHDRRSFRDLLTGSGEGIEVILESKQTVLCHSAEYVRVPPHLSAQLSMRSSFARDWLDHSAADSIWPGFQGQITFELRNDGPRPFSLRSGMRPLQLAFVRMATTPARPYNGLYQNQEGQLHSRLPKELT